jgi:DNA-binding transcriptional LysR family regulator
MDRIDALTAFIAAADENSLAGASRRLGRSPAAVTRAIASLERRIGTRLLYGTTRVVRMTEAGEQYLASCRHIEADLEEADRAAAGERTAPRGMLTVTARCFWPSARAAAGRCFPQQVSVGAGAPPPARSRGQRDRRRHGRSRADRASARLGPLRYQGERGATAVVCESGYLARRKVPRAPTDLKSHDCISFNAMTPSDVWTFAPSAKGNASKQVRVFPRLTVTEAEAAIGAAVDGHGVTRVLSYQVERELKSGPPQGDSRGLRAHALAG